MDRTTFVEEVGTWGVALLLVAVLGCNSALNEPIGGSANIAGSRGALGSEALSPDDRDDAGAGIADASFDPATYTGDEVPFAALKTTEADVVGTQVAAGGPVPGVMQQKLQDAINTLSDPQSAEELHLRAIDQAMEALFMSNLVVLPTGGPAAPTVDPLFTEFEMMMQDAINALTQHTAPMGPGTPDSKGAAWDARNFLQVTEEALQVIGQQTGACNPSNLRDPACALLLQGDEGGVDVDVVFPGFSRQVRSPFFIGQGSATIQEQVIVPDVIAPDECAIVLKEIQGVKAVVRTVVIPIWVEPWNARATIVGYTTVWVWEFIPAEFLKTITYCNNNGAVVQDVEIVTVLERALSHFWSFMNMDVTTHP